jgi:hypothetical protein
MKRRRENISKKPEDKESFSKKLISNYIVNEFKR